MRKHFDLWSIVVIALTLVLFVVALFVKGVSMTFCWRPVSFWSQSS